MKKYLFRLFPLLFPIFSAVPVLAAYEVQSQTCNLGVGSSTEVSLIYGDTLSISGWSAGDTAYIKAISDSSNDGTYTFATIYPDPSGNNVSTPFPASLDSTATGGCVISPNPIIFGCTDPAASNYNSSATEDKQTIIWNWNGSPEDMPSNSCSYVPPVAVSGTVWAMSALSIFTLINFVYFCVFFTIIYVIAWGVIQVFRPILRILTYGD